MLWEWFKVLEITEVPTSYQIACGLTAIGASLRRSVFVSQIQWKIYPAMRVLLVGPSGIGKDTAINPAEKVIRKVGATTVAGGRTYERLLETLADLPPPACAFIAAGELTNFIGQRDYQSGMIQGLTDLLSDKEVFDASIKSEKDKTVIYRPTVSMIGGSTKEWLHKAMPKGALEGGFIPRFLVVPEEYSRRQVALVSVANDPDTTSASQEALVNFTEFIKHLARRYNIRRKPHCFHMTQSAEDMYTNWYWNRLKYFSPLVREYAERCRDTVLRLAMLCGISCDRGHIRPEDVEFAIMFMTYVSAQLDQILIPPHAEAKCGREILAMLPSRKSQILQTLAPQYPRQLIDNAIETLYQAKRVKKVALPQHHDILYDKA